MLIKGMVHVDQRNGSCFCRWLYCLPYLFNLCITTTKPGGGLGVMVFNVTFNSYLGNSLSLCHVLYTVS